MRLAHGITLSDKQVSRENMDEHRHAQMWIILCRLPVAFHDASRTPTPYVDADDIVELQYGFRDDWEELAIGKPLPKHFVRESRPFIGLR